MKKALVSLSMCFSLLVIAGCQPQSKVSLSPLPQAVEELQTQTVPEVKKQSDIVTQSPMPTQAGVTLYRGSWFDIKYPSNFIPRPTSPTNKTNAITSVQTDEAYFTSPDSTVEFFVFSPLWGGNPENYLNISNTEEQVSEKTETRKENDYPGQFGDKTIRWLTIKAKDSSYYRSLISIKEQIGTGSDLHHVFGIKYKNNDAYAKYRDAYAAFKNSVRQYSD
ncbi:MAG: hypothetical protein HY817_01800 [Candidatus Abawacabacteria bacterium]|nr:hypothetical protein [Candidatus Abawacabacteria bacterium]